MEEIGKLQAMLNGMYRGYEGPPMGTRPSNGVTYELATAFIGGKGYWHCPSCDCWHEDRGY